MIILGIETSCDETAAALVKKEGNKIEVLSSEIATSLEMHAKSGGIIPENAAREQIKSILPVIEKTISKIPHQVRDDMAWLDAIAVTYGPGLIGSLLAGVETAKTLSLVWDKPIVPVNHLHGHLYACFIEHNPEFPAVGLVVSGGHTDFVYIKDHGQIEYIGGTRDDAAGEAFDKTARIIELGYPGGPAIAAAAAKCKVKGEKLKIFPRPMINDDSLDMSFSGLKTAVANYVKVKTLNTDHRSLIAANIQEAIVDTLVAKSLIAIEKYRPRSFLLSGGVAANKRLEFCLRKVAQSISKSPQIYVSSVKNSTDNAAMIATTALYNYRPIHWSEISANPSLAIDS